MQEETAKSLRQDDLMPKESHFNPYSEVNGLFFTQEITHFEEKLPMEEKCEG